MRIIDRINAPLPAFFRTLRTIGLVLTTLGAALMSSPIALPASILSAAGYLVVAGSAIGAVSQLTTSEEEQKPLPPRP